MPGSPANSTLDLFWDDLFLACAFAAYLDQATLQRGEPDSELTRRRAYRYYEDALTIKSGHLTS